MEHSSSAFGNWIKRRRRALDMTQEQLAQQVGYGIVTIRKIEQNQRRPSRELAVRLADCLQIPPEARSAFFKAARGGPEIEGLSTPPPVLTSPAGQRSNLPLQLSSFIGREQHLAAIAALLGGHSVRLLTLTGAGGTGKTRLALQLAAELLDAFEAVYFIDLSPIRDPQLVSSAIAHALEITDDDQRPLEQRLCDYFAGRRSLLVLDNYEQVVASAPLLIRLLQAAPWLTVLVTSRVPLKLRGEQEYQLPPMGLPDLKQLPPLEQLSQYEALRLFVERAREARPDFSVTAVTAPAIAAICHRLDGLPLAIELAAARVRALPPQLLLERLDQRLQLLTDGPRDLPARQQTLRNTLDWSYRLLEEEQQRLFRRLGVFVGSCTLEAAETICRLPGEPELDVFEGLVSLLEKSMLRQEEQAGRPYFGMLETLREYALEQLEQSGELELLRGQHAHYYLSLIERAYERRLQPERTDWGEIIWQEYENLRTALSWLVQVKDHDATLQLAGALWWMWHKWGSYSEGRRWLEQALMASEQQQPAMRARALIGAAWLTYRQGELALAQTLGEQSLALFRAVEDQEESAHAMRFLGVIARDQGDLERARTFYEGSRELCRALGHRIGVAHASNGLGELARLQGDYAEAARCYELALSLWREDKILERVGLALSNLAQVRLVQGDLSQATELFGESLALKRATGEPFGQAMVLSGLAHVAATYGEAERAAQMLGMTQALLERLRAKLDRPDQAAYERAEVLTRAQLDTATWEAALTAGRALPLEQALDEAEAYVRSVMEGPERGR